MKRYKMDRVNKRALLIVEINENLDTVSRGVSYSAMPFNKKTMDFHVLSDIEHFITWCWDNNYMKTCRAAMELKFDIMKSCIDTDWDFTAFLKSYQQYKNEFIRGGKYQVKGV